MTQLTVLPDGWMDRDGVMKTLDRSQSTIERMVASGDIETMLKRVAGRKPLRLYRGSDIERIAQEAQRKENRVALRPRVKAPLVSLPTPASEPALPPERRDRLWLSLEEAADASGLSQLFLLGSIDTGKLTAVKGGPHGAWRIRRASLEAFAG